MSAQAGADFYEGRGGNDVILPGSGDDEVDGGPGRDTVVFGDDRSAFTVRHESGAIVVSHSGEGRDRLIAVERLRFDNVSLAFDLDGDGTAGKAARVIGTLLGRAALADAALVGGVISLLDQGLDAQSLIAAALATPQFLQVAGSASSEDLVALVFRNLLGIVPTADQSRPFVALLDSGAVSRAALIDAAAQLEITAARIDLVGLGETGLVYQSSGLP